MKWFRKTTGKREGIILISTTTSLTLMTLIAGSFIATSLTNIRQMKKWKESDECFLLAQSAMEQAKYDIYVKFRKYFDAAPLSGTSEKFRWFNVNSDGMVGSNDPYTCPVEEPYKDGIITVTIENTKETKWPGYRDGPFKLKLRVDAEREGVKRSVTEYVLYKLEASEVFDYAYFINNFGWFYGSTITANGDVRANGDFHCKYDPYINGDVKACINPDNGAQGNVIGSWRSRNLSWWWNDGPDRARPGDPPSASFTEGWDMGYNGDPVAWEHLDPLEMPYLGDLSEYTYLATNYDGRITQGGVTLITNVYNGPGPNPAPTAWADDGCIILIGTQSDPIEIDGPVVVMGDLIIKGYYTGKGTIYAGRNVHIAGDLVAMDYPTWDKPDNDPETTAAVNANKDLLVLAAKGNVLFGDYTESSWRSAVNTYIKPNFTKSYTTDSSDYHLGYDSDWNPNNGYRFNGDYTGYDGGKRLDNSGNIVNRRYYEASLSPNIFHAVANSEEVDRVDAVVYNNHLVGGHTGPFKNNGCLIGRDEAIIFSGSVTMNWDIRVGSRSKDAVDIGLYLPRILAKPTRLYWEESSG
ncbi:MAG: hypothetical protein EOM20_02685 [Spartobacteria bacterium]|nr:hypothetical protein [Spartobacteria bacterium]